MPRKRPGRPQWFRLQSSLYPISESFNKEDVGEALYLALRYFETGELPDENTSPMALTFFMLLKAEADKSLNEYKQAVEYGRQSQLHAELSTMGQGA